MALSPSVVPQESKEDNANCVETKPSQTASIASEDPLQNLCLASQEVLRKAQQSGRSRCRQCGGSRMFYCYTCCVPVGNVPTEQIPCVQLPLKIDIIKHPNETDGKSTAVHAKLLAPDSVNIYTYPCIPEYEGKDHEVVLVFPGPQSISIEDVSFHLQKRIESKGRNKADNLDVPPQKLRRTTDEEGWDLHESTRQGPELKRVVFIDSTWSQTNQIASDERLREPLAHCTRRANSQLLSVLQSPPPSHQRGRHCSCASACAFPWILGLTQVVRLLCSKCAAHWAVSGPCMPFLPE